MADPSVPPPTHGIVIYKFAYPTTKKVDLPKVFRLGIKFWPDRF
jgi:hypothetical protein